MQVGATYNNIKNLQKNIKKHQERHKSQKNHTEEKAPLPFPKRSPHGRQVQSWQLDEDRAALALAWDAPPDSAGADTARGRWVEMDGFGEGKVGQKRWKIGGNLMGFMVFLLGLRWFLV